MNVLFSDPASCCGCGACAAVCPSGALQMTADAEGFLYPTLSPQLCLDCGRCRTCCPLQAEDYARAAKAEAFFLVKHCAPAVLSASTSGGAFTALSDALLARGGTVYGAVFDKALRVHHTRAVTAAERDAMRISKYVQSDLSSVYQPLREDLRQGKPVLFSGTPCQNAAIRCSCADLPQKAREQLFLCDIICHSVPSPLFWEDYQQLLAAEAGAPLVWARFRGKDIPWSRANSNRGFAYRVAGENAIRKDDRFYRLYLSGLPARPSCYCCPYTDLRRSGDVTIADYWGLEEQDPASYDPRGVSLLLVNTAQGAMLLQTASSWLLRQQRPAAEALAAQQRLREPLARPNQRAAFWQDYQMHGLAYCFAHYLPPKMC